MDVTHCSKQAVSLACLRKGWGYFLQLKGFSFFFASSQLLEETSKELTL